ncbi:MULTISPECIES: hypothetical protein [unclassified Streptomyces]|uniref:hypothetical protein n=1 Tax=unclassified Streptomyces TaxID=2593676 RepID=UPI00343103AC
MDGFDASQWAAPAVQALISSMSSDLWASARARFARVLARRSGATEDVLDDLDEARQQMVDRGDADEVRDEISAEWLNRFRRALTRDPSLVEEIRSLVDEYGHKAASSEGGVTQNVNASGHAVIFNQGTGTQNNRMEPK